MKTEYTTPYIEENGGSYTNIYRNDVIWLGGVEKSLAREICTKLNDYEKLQSRVSELQKEVESYKQEKWENINDADQTIKALQADKERLERENEELKNKLK